MFGICEEAKTNRKVIIFPKEDLSYLGFMWAQKRKKKIKERARNKIPPELEKQMVNADRGLGLFEVDNKNTLLVLISLLCVCVCARKITSSAGWRDRISRVGVRGGDYEVISLSFPICPTCQHSVLYFTILPTRTTWTSMTHTHTLPVASPTPN